MKRLRLKMQRDHVQNIPEHHVPEGFSIHFLKVVLSENGRVSKGSLMSLKQKKPNGSSTKRTLSMFKMISF